MLDSPQHFAGIGFASSLMLAVLATCFAVGHRRRRPWGLAWLAAWALLSALRGLLDAVSTGTPAAPDWIWADPVLGGTALAALVVGLYAYVGRPGRRAWRRFAALSMASWGLAALAQQFDLGELSEHVASTLLFIHLAGLCAGWRGPVAGGTHVLLAGALVAHPVFVLGLGAGLLGLPADPLRGWSALSLALLGLALLVTIGRRLRLDLQRELDARQQAETELRLLNQSLEKRVQIRTRHLEELVEGLESFNRMVSHDLRGPLSGIVGVLALADRSLQQQDLAQVGRWMGMIDREARRLIELVHRMLLLARASSAELDRSAISLEELLKEALHALALSRGGRSPEVVTFDPLPQATVDAQLMRQVFINLVGNALKFAGEAVDARVHVSATRRPGAVVVEVRDNGPGFESERAKDLFQPFTRLHGSGYEGSGIGLTIVRRIVERHGGKVWAEGRPAQGASFFFSVPAAAAA